MITLGPATLYISGLEGEEGDIMRVSIQKGTGIITRFELPAGELMKALRGRVTPITLIGRSVPSK